MEASPSEPSPSSPVFDASAPEPSKKKKSRGARLSKAEREARREAREAAAVEDTAGASGTFEVRRKRLQLLVSRSEWDEAASLGGESLPLARDLVRALVKLNRHKLLTHCAARAARTLPVEALAELVQEALDEGRLAAAVALARGLGVLERFDFAEHALIAYETGATQEAADALGSEPQLQLRTLHAMLATSRCLQLSTLPALRQLPATPWLLLGDEVPHEPVPPGERGCEPAVPGTPAVEADPTSLVQLIRLDGRASVWCFSEDVAAVLEGLPPALPGGVHLRLRTVAADGTLATGGRVWHSAPALCRWLLAERGSIRGTAVCELGSGTGAVGLYAAGLGASMVVLTDGASELLPLIEHNVRRNAQLVAEAACQAALVRWGSAEDLAALETPRLSRGDPSPLRFDWILGSDTIYDPASHAPLCATLRMLFDRHAGTPPPPRVIFATMPRSRTPSPTDRSRYVDAAMARFEEVAAAHGLRVTAMKTSQSVWTDMEWLDAAPFVFEVARAV
jgi:predicted nicotinamide N-methyase